MLDWLAEEGISESLRFRDAVFSAEGKKVTFTFSSPAPLGDEEFRFLSEKVKARECCGLTFVTEIVPDRQNHETLRAAMMEYLKENYYSVYMRFAEGGYYINKTKGEDNYSIVFRLNEETLGLFAEMNLIDRLNGFFADYTVTPVNVSYVVSEDSENFEETVRKIDARQRKAAADIVLKAEKTIPVTNVSGIIGRAVRQAPTFISELKREDMKVCVCGEIKSLRSDLPTSSDAGYALRVRFRLEDFSGGINVTMFLGGEETEKFGKLSVGEKVIVRGKTRSYAGVSGSEITLTAYALSSCEIGEVRKSAGRAVPEEYTFVFPEPYIITKQTGMFDKPEIIPEFLKGKNVVAFDLETTGLNPLRDSIIEIGAVRLRDGVICESFETLVDPLVHVPDEASKVNHITDEMLAGQPRITQVIGDFRKFCDGAILVAHNIPFDFVFVREAAERSGYRFENVRWDTLEIAKNYYGSRPAGVASPRDYKLQTLAKLLGVKAEDAHRAKDDARVCAEVLVRLVTMSGGDAVDEIEL